MNYRMTPEEREQLRIKNFKKVLKNDRKLSDTDILELRKENDLSSDQIEFLKKYGEKDPSSRDIVIDGFEVLKGEGILLTIEEWLNNRQ